MNYDSQNFSNASFKEMIENKNVFDVVAFIIWCFFVLSFSTGNNCKSYLRNIRAGICFIFVFYLLHIVLFINNGIDYSIDIGIFSIGPKWLLFYLIFVSGFFRNLESESTVIVYQQANARHLNNIENFKTQTFPPYSQI